MVADDALKQAGRIAFIEPREQCAILSSQHLDGFRTRHKGADNEPTPRVVRPKDAEWIAMDRARKRVRVAAREGRGLDRGVQRHCALRADLPMMRAARFARPYIGIDSQAGRFAAS